MNKMCEDKKMMGKHSGPWNNKIRSHFDNSPKRLTFDKCEVNTPWDKHKQIQPSSDSSSTSTKLQNQCNLYAVLGYFFQDSVSSVGKRHDKIKRKH